MLKTKNMQEYLQECRFYFYLLVSLTPEGTHKNCGSCSGIAVAPTRLVKIEKNIKSAVAAEFGGRKN
jgi:hypothetical protein